MAISRFGKPQRIRTDNASVFHSAEFAAGLASLGIRHEFSKPGQPWQNGRIERLFWSLKQRLNLLAPDNLDSLNKLLEEFSFWYNEIRPHQHLYGYTPAEVWYGINPYTTAPKSVQRFEAWGGLLGGYPTRPKESICAKFRACK